MGPGATFLAPALFDRTRRQCDRLRRVAAVHPKKSEPAAEGRGAKLFSYRRRPVHLGPFALERLARAPAPAEGEGAPAHDAPTKAEGGSETAAGEVGLPHAAFEHVRGAQLAADLLHADVLALVAE